MLQFLLILSSTVLASSVYHYDYDEHSQKSFTHRYNDEYDTPVVLKKKAQTELATRETDLVVTITKDLDSTTARSMKCISFNEYALSCSVNAAIIYNSSNKYPPIPSRLFDWCSAIRFLTNCALDWNSDCREHSDNYFNEESIKGHIHVLERICDDEWFVSRYATMQNCISATSEAWEKCYTSFKIIVDDYKNSTKDWTHYETHFYLCCARTQFRRCTLDVLFSDPPQCSHEQGVILQKFSTVVSEGDVFQDCELNVMYSNCPTGDPRPNKVMLAKLVGVKEAEQEKSAAIEFKMPCLLLLCALFFVLYYK